MTIEEFRAYGGLVEPPQLHFPVENQVQPIFSNTPSEVTTRGACPSQSVDTGRLRAIENASGQQDALKLKRNKPLARTASKLESTLGIIRKQK